MNVREQGPFVHISSMITNQLFKIFGKVTTIPNEYETRFQELITIASAVGVAASECDGGNTKRLPARLTIHACP